MTLPIPETDEEQIVEIPLAEYEAVKLLAVGMAEQNAAVLSAQNAMLEAMRQMIDVAQTQSDSAQANIAELLRGINFSVNVPEQPAPSVIVNVPEGKPPVVNVKMTDKERKVDLKVVRDRNNVFTGVTGTVK